MDSPLHNLSFQTRNALRPDLRRVPCAARQIDAIAHAGLDRLVGLGQEPRDRSGHDDYHFIIIVDMRGVIITGGIGPIIGK